MFFFNFKSYYKICQEQCALDSPKFRLLETESLRRFHLGMQQQQHLRRQVPVTSYLKGRYGFTAGLLEYNGLARSHA